MHPPAFIHMRVVLVEVEAAWEPHLLGHPDEHVRLPHQRILKRLSLGVCVGHERPDDERPILIDHVANRSPRSGAVRPDTGAIVEPLDRWLDPIDPVEGRHVEADEVRPGHAEHGGVRLSARVPLPPRREVGVEPEMPLIGGERDRRQPWPIGPRIKHELVVAACRLPPVDHAKRLREGRHLFHASHDKLGFSRHWRGGHGECVCRPHR